MSTREAIERVYAVFANHRAGRVEGCPCCVTEEERARLLGHRLREVPAKDLEHFAFSALDTWGALKDLKHFLPRILEVYAAGELKTELQVVYGKIVQEGTWPEVERAALEEVTRELFVDAVTRGQGFRAREILESAGLSGMDARSMMERGFARRSTSEVLDAPRASALAELVGSHTTAMISGGTSWIWWRTDEARVVETWLLSGEPYALLLSAFEAAPDHAHARSWAEACDVLEALGGRT